MKKIIYKKKTQMIVFDVCIYLSWEEERAAEVQYAVRVYRRSMRVSYTDLCCTSDALPLVPELPTGLLRGGPPILRCYLLRLKEKIRQ